MPLNLPSAYPGNPSGYVTYYKAQADNYSMSAVYARNPLESQTVLNWEMSSMLANCSRSIATKVYVADAGNWSTAANWFPTGVPAAGDNVLIGEGVSVTYDVDSPTTSLSFVRIDGTLYHPHNVSTAINVNTIFITPTGKHQVATESTPLSASRTCRIIFSSSTDMDPSVDVALQTKGIVSAGTRKYFGAAKTPFLKVVSNAGPAAGATGLVLEYNPSGWKVGDRITICGTRNGNHYYGGYYYIGDEEETRTITALGLSGTVSLNTALTYGHTAPSSTLVATNTMRAYVANLTRNIQFVTENGTTCLRHRRAHDMQMHYPTYDARSVEWRDMGRTNKGYIWGGVQTYQNFPNLNITANTLVNNGYSVVNGTISLSTEAAIEISQYEAGGAQSIVVEGYDRSGTAISTVVQVPLTGRFFNTGFYTRVTRAYPTTSNARVLISINHRSRLMTSSGIRNTNGTLMSSGWTYESPYKEANIQGRYPVHFHKCGIVGDVFTTPVSMFNCVVSNSPGWGFVHHLSHVNFIDCVAHDMPGAGFMAEAGNESGLWQGCYAVKVRGNLTLKGDNDDVSFIDPGRGGGFWFTGRLLKVDRCVAADCFVGFFYNVRFEQTKLTTEQLDQPRSIVNTLEPHIDEAPIIHFRNTESIGCSYGFFLTKSNQFQGHDVRTHLGPHLSWGCVYGFDVEYTQHYAYEDITCVAGFFKDNVLAVDGFKFGGNISDQVLSRVRIDGFQRGIDLNHTNANDSRATTATANGRIVIDPTFVNVGTQYINYDPAIDVITTSASLTNTISLSLSLTSFGGRKWLPYSTTNDINGVGQPLRSGWKLVGTRIDSVAHKCPADLNVFPGGVAANLSRDYPFLQNTLQTAYCAAHGTFTDPVLGPTFHLPAFFGDRVTSELHLKMVPATIIPGTTATLAVYNRGNADYTKYDSVDNRPAPANLRVSLAQNTTTNINLLAGATHSLSISMYVVAVTKPFNSHLVDNKNGTVTVVPRVNYTGTETFSYWVADNNANVTKATAIIEVNQTGGTGRAGVNDFIAAQYNTPVSVNVLANDIGDSKALETVTVVGGNAVGTASISTGGIIVFTPTSTFAVTVTQTAEIQYTFTASGGSAGASLFVTVNAAPATGVSGTPDFAATQYNTPVSLNVLDNDIGDNKVALTAVVTGGNAVGTATFNGNQLIFTPTNTFATVATQTATVNYTFTASGGSSGAAWLVTVNPPPATGRAGLADFNSTTYNVAVSTNVLANDIGDNKVLQTAVVVGGAAVGTASISTGGIIVFTPTSTYATVATQTAEVQYTFTASGGSAGASLFITVNPPPPTGRAGVADFNSTTWNAAVSTNVLANDIGDSKVLLTATVVGGNSVGTASISTGGIIVFTPSSTFARTITQVAEIQYTFTASGGSAGASLFVTVNAGPPLPVAVADFTSTTYNQAVSFNVLANDTGGTTKTVLTASVVGGNSVGTASISTGGVIVFTPSSTFAATLTQVAEIQYTFTTTGGSAAGSLFVTVNAGPSIPASITYTSPVATDGTAQAYVGRSNGIFATRQAYDTNPDGYILLNAATRIDGVDGTVDFDPVGIIYVTPNASGTMRLSYRVINQVGLTAQAVMTIYATNAPTPGSPNAGGASVIGAPVSWSRKSVSNIKSVAKAISTVFADLDPNDPIRLAERMVRKYSFAEIKKLIGTADFESLLDMELQELVDEMERMKNGN